jgi:TRAP-type uncharacterized transport system substrate-binding protein
VQADVYQAFLDRAKAGNADTSNIIKPLRVVLPLYNTEIHYIVRADSPYNYLHDIKDARINGGVVGSGAALITHTLYRMMFNAPMPEANASYLSNEEALVKLIGDKSVDVVVVAAGQPAPLISNMKPEAQKYIKLLKFDPAQPSSKLPLTIYSQSIIKASSYPRLLQQDFTTISVGAYLVTYDYNLRDTVVTSANSRDRSAIIFQCCRKRGIPNGAKSASHCPRFRRAGLTIRRRRARFVPVALERSRALWQSPRSLAARRNAYSVSAVSERPFHSLTN